MALGYTLAGILLVGGLLLAAGLGAALWMAASALRPEDVRRPRRGEDRPG